MKNAGCAVDIGGSHGRVVLGTYDGECIRLIPAASFECGTCMEDGILRWNAQEMIQNIILALQKAWHLSQGAMYSVGVDSMGNNSVLLDAGGNLITLPAYTRVPPNGEIMKSVFERVSPGALFGEVGLQLHKLGALYTIALFQKKKPAYFEKARHFMMMNDWFNYVLGGELGSEYTIASTSHFMKAGRAEWSKRVIRCMGLDEGLFPDILPTGTRLGKAEFGVPESVAELISVPGHDTACAALCADENQAFVSMGTWIMVGCVFQEAILTREALEAGFANEGAAFGGIRFLHSSMGLHVLKRCMDKWNENAKISLDDAVRLAKASREDCGRIDFSDPDLLLDDDMPAAIRRHCADRGQNVPEGIGEILRCIFESIADHIASKLQILEKIIGSRFSSVRILGGASSNDWLMQRIADRASIRVYAGPEEAAVLGSLLVQWVATGVFSDMQAARRALEVSFPPRMFLPS